MLRLILGLILIALPAYPRSDAAIGQMLSFSDPIGDVQISPSGKSVAGPLADTVDLKEVSIDFNHTDLQVNFQVVRLDALNFGNANSIASTQYAIRFSHRANPKGYQVIAVFNAPLQWTFGLYNFSSSDSWESLSGKIDAPNSIITVNVPIRRLGGFQNNDPFSNITVEAWSDSTDAVATTQVYDFARPPKGSSFVTLAAASSTTETPSASLKSPQAGSVGPGEVRAPAFQQSGLVAAIGLATAIHRRKQH